MKIVDLVPGWFAGSPRIRSPHTRQQYRTTLLQFSAHTGNRHVSTYTEADLVKFCTHGGRAPGTILARRQALMSFFDWACYAGHCPEDPSRNLKRRVNVTNKTVREHVWLTRAQLRELLDGATDDRDRLALHLAAYTGLRVAELSKLTWDNIVLEHGYLTVLGKGDKHAVVGIPKALADVLSEIPVEERRGPIVKGRGWKAQGEQLGPPGWRSIIVRNGKRIGVPALRPHDMRRTLAGILDGDGVPREEIQSVLRHSNPTTTARYLRDNPFQGVATLKGFQL